ncbi:OmpH family outer membrane protein [Tamlana sp. s12]|nr:membrane protein [Tamlana sp. s12]QQY83949.1 OmpH family outer membrane protein [Tamlana sp. s12]
MLTKHKSNVLFLLILIFTACFNLHAQRGVRIGYIDTEYILENVPEYQEATKQLNQKAEKWKNEIHEKLQAVEQKRKDLTTEKVLLTEELIHEREEDIDFEESEILDYQQKRFGPNGDLFIQRKQLMQPIQDQIFSAVQDIAEGKKYDFIFDKSSDATMLFSAKRYDLSEQILRSISRTAKRNQAQNRTERKAAEQEELVPEINEELEARESAAEARKREVLAAREAKKQEALERRQKIIEERERERQAKLDARNGVTPQEESEVGDNIEESGETAKENAPETKTREQLIEENRQKKLADREARKKELEERKRKILEERQRARDSINQNK